MCIRDRDYTVQIMIQFPVRFYGQRVGSSFYNFIGIGIVERKVTAMLAFHQTTRNGKVIESAVLFTFFESGWDGNGAVDVYKRQSYMQATIVYS